MKKQVFAAFISILSLAQLAQAESSALTRLDSVRAELAKKAVISEAQAREGFSFDQGCSQTIQQAKDVFMTEPSKQYTMVFSTSSKKEDGSTVFNQIILRTDETRNKILKMHGKKFEMGSVEVNKGTLADPKFEKVQQPVRVQEYGCFEK